MVVLSEIKAQCASSSKLGGIRGNRATREFRCLPCVGPQWGVVVVGDWGGLGRCTRRHSSLVSLRYTPACKTPALEDQSLFCTKRTGDGHEKRKIMRP